MVRTAFDLTGESHLTQALEDAASEYIRWGLAVVNAAALDNEEAAGELIGMRMAEMNDPAELMMMVLGLTEAGAVYVRATADASQSTVEDVVQRIGLVSMEDPVA